MVGIDSFEDYYPSELKEANLREIGNHSHFDFRRENLLQADLGQLLKGITAVFHLAAQPGVRSSWGQQFDTYLRNNIQATQRLLEACIEADLEKFVFASSSSVYGDAENLPVKETDLPVPVSPYGVTKLAAEDLCHLYQKSYGLPVISLRYFTVYGPRQRSDMAFHRFIRAILSGEELSIYGDGEQTRDFTFISDAVDANLLALDLGKSQEGRGSGERGLCRGGSRTAPTHAPALSVAEGSCLTPHASVFNIGGGTRYSVNQVIRLLEEIIGRKAKVKYVAVQRGDTRDTFADLRKARRVLGYRPQISLEEGLRRQVESLS